MLSSVHNQRPTNRTGRNSVSQERVQRRLAAILFADVVGYSVMWFGPASRLMRQDREITGMRLVGIPD